MSTLYEGILKKNIFDYYKIQGFFQVHFPKYLVKRCFFKKKFYYMLISFFSPSVFYSFKKTFIIVLETHNQ